MKKQNNVHEVCYATSSFVRWLLSCSLFLFIRLCSWFCLGITAIAACSSSSCCSFHSLQPLPLFQSRHPLPASPAQPLQLLHAQPNLLPFSPSFPTAVVMICCSSSFPACSFVQHNKFEFRHHPFVRNSSPSFSCSSERYNSKINDASLLSPPE